MAGALRVGLRIDRYELTRQIAEGGFGVIFQAKDVNLGRDLAIKFLLPQHNSNPEIVSRFVGEARTLARVVHPGIVTVYESGEVKGTNTKADGTAFILMELLDGETLSQRIKRTGPMPPANAMEICRQVANALNAAHQLGMIHRDLKPDNIMLTRDPAIAIGERAKVLDFGIAKNAANTSVSAATQIGMVFGTPAYMSPEQCRSSTDVTPASDVYALGCILFELLLGRPPFLGSGMGELFAAHLMSAPPVPSSLNPSLPRHLDEVIGAMLAKEPGGRPANMMVVERILEDSRLGGVANKPIRTRTLGGAILVGDLPFPPKAGFAVDMGPGRPVAPSMPTPTPTPTPLTTERGHHPSGPQTPITQPAVEAPRMTPPQGNASDSTLLGATRPVIPTAAEAAEMMRKRSPSTAPPHMATVAMQASPALPTSGLAQGPAAGLKTVMAQLPVMAPVPVPVTPAPAPAPTMIAPGSGPREEPPRAHANPTTMSSAMGQSTPRPQAPKSGSKLWLVGAVLGAIAIAVIIVVVAGRGGSGDDKGASQPSGSAETPVGSSHNMPLTNDGSATATTGSNTGSATPAVGSNAGSATTAIGSNAGSAIGSGAGSDTGSAVAHTGSDTGSATAQTGSDTGSAIAHTGSDAGSATAHTGSNALVHAGSNTGSAHAGSNAGSALPHAGSNAGSAVAHAGSNAIPHAGSGSTVPHAGSGAGSAKKPKDPHAGSGSAKCQGRSCILDGEF